MNCFTKVLRVAAVSAILILPAASVSAQTTPKMAAAKAPSESAPTPQAIADAKAKGMVWVNTSTKVYHKDGQFYGATKHGKFMTEDDANKAGYHAAKASPIGKKAAPAAKPAAK